MRAIRQGDLLLISVRGRSGKKLPHLTLAEGLVTGHAHRIQRGQAELYKANGTLYLRVLSNTAELSHEEHHTLQIPQGHWMVRMQREYQPQKRSLPPLPKLQNQHDELAQYLSHQPSSTSKKARSSPQTPQSSNTPTKNNTPKPQDSDTIFLHNLIAQIDGLSEQELLQQSMEDVTKKGPKSTQRRRKNPSRQRRRVRQGQSHPPSAKTTKPMLQSRPGSRTPNQRQSPPQNWRDVVD